MAARWAAWCVVMCTGKWSGTQTPARADAPLVSVVLKWAPGLGTAPACLQLGWVGGRHQGCGASLKWDLS